MFALTFLAAPNGWFFVLAGGDRTRPRPVDDEGSVAVGRNTERHKEIHRRSEATMFLTGKSPDFLYANGM